MSEIEVAPAPWVDKMTQANRLLAEVADDPFRASRVWDFAEAARVYAIQMDLGTAAINHAVAVKLKAKRLMALAVDKGQAEGSIATRQTAHKRSSPTPGGDPPKTLSEIGITQQRVSEARKIAEAFSEEDIDLAAADATLAGEELSSAQMMSRAREVAAARKATEEPSARDALARQVAALLPARLLELDVVAVAAALTDTEADHMRRVTSDLSAWCVRFEEARFAREDP